MHKNEVIGGREQKAHKRRERERRNDVILKNSR